MRGSKAKLLRKAFPNRREYRAMKKAYRTSSIDKRLEASRTLNKMKGKKIYRLEVEDAGQ